MNGLVAAVIIYCIVRLIQAPLATTGLTEKRQSWMAAVSVLGILAILITALAAWSLTGLVIQ